MERTRNKQRGFSTGEVLIVIVIIGVLGATGWFVFQRSRTKVTDTTGSTNSTNQQTDTKPKPDVYANWKTYCDSFYRYCFKYPSDWSLSVNSRPSSYCETGQVSLLDPSKALQLNYTNTDPHDNGLFTIYPVSITNLSAANQALSIVGSYIAVAGPPNSNGLAGNDVPSFRVYDSSVLSQYPLTIGQPSQFLTNSMFTDKNTGAYSCTGSLSAMPTFSVNSVTDAKAWFDRSESKTSLLILKSFYYQPKL